MTIDEIMRCAAMEIYIGILIPFIGTALGSACVLFMKGSMNPKVQRSLAGFAAGVMVAASVWSLIIPALEKSEAAKARDIILYYMKKRKQEILTNGR